MNKANEVIDDVARQFGVTRNAVLGKRRDQRFVFPRAVVCYILHRKCGMSSKDVGRAINRTHATVLYHCLAVDDWLKMPFLNMEAVKIVREVERLHGLTSEQLN